MSTPTPDGWLPTTVQTLLDRAGDDVARLEVALLAAWRPTTLLAHADLPGCVLRWHHQMTKRANSLLVLGPTRPPQHRPGHLVVRPARPRPGPVGHDALSPAAGPGQRRRAHYDLRPGPVPGRG